MKTVAGLLATAALAVAQDFSSGTRSAVINELYPLQGSQAGKLYFPSRGKTRIIHKKITGSLLRLLSAGGTLLTFKGSGFQVS